MPDTERLLKLANIIEEWPENFDMGHWFHHANEDGNFAVDIIESIGKIDLHRCGTTACIAGWAVWLWPEHANDEDGIVTSAADILGLDSQTANDLFNEITLDVDEAAARLRELAAS